MKPLFLSTLLGAALLCLNGCAVSLGSDQNGTRTPTVGQQLVDLKKARDAGAMTEEEYLAQKQKVLAGK